MAWSWKVARFKGIDVSIHFTFPLLLLWIGLNYWKATQSMAMVLQGLSLIVLLFTCVVLHEFGHALTARRFGIKTRSITLLPIGGVAAMESMPRDPRQEILVALAGPAVNLVIAAALWLWLAVTGLGGGPGSLLTDGSSMLHQLMIINLVLAVFNLLPAFPMDGGAGAAGWVSARYGARRCDAQSGCGRANPGGCHVCAGYAVQPVSDADCGVCLVWRRRRDERRYYALCAV